MTPPATSPGRLISRGHQTFSVESQARPMGASGLIGNAFGFGSRSTCGNDDA